MAATGEPPRDSSGSQTLERGLRVLDLLATHPQGLAVAGLADLLGTHRANVYRLLRPLEDQRLVDRGPDGSYVLGVGLLRLASHVRSTVRDVAARELQDLADEVASTCALTVRDGDGALVVLVREPAASRVHIAYRPGLRHRLTQGAAGLAMLAAAPPHPGERTEVGTARRLGYAVTHDELFTGATGVAAPLVGRSGTALASISIVWLGDTVPEEVAATALRRTASRINDALAAEGADAAEALYTP